MAHPVSKVPGFQQVCAMRLPGRACCAGARMQRLDAQRHAAVRALLSAQCMLGRPPPPPPPPGGVCAGGPAKRECQRRKPRGVEGRLAGRGCDAGGPADIRCVFGAGHGSRRGARARAPATCVC
jgi:hypothetical protein